VRILELEREWKGEKNGEEKEEKLPHHLKNHSNIFTPING
jgi:hypothetical protein